jgi:hypothetical protein
MVRMKAFFTTSLAGAVAVACADSRGALASAAEKQNVHKAEKGRQDLGVIRHY